MSDPHCATNGDWDNEPDYLDELNDRAVSTRRPCSVHQPHVAHFYAVVLSGIPGPTPMSNHICPGVDHPIPAHPTEQTNERHEQ